MPNEGEILTNASFDYVFAGKTYSLKRANLRQIIEWQRKIIELSKAGKIATNGELLAVAIFTALHSVDPTITEDYVLDNSQGASDIDLNKTLEQLGFLSQQKVKSLKQKNSLANPPSGETSSVS